MKIYLQNQIQVEDQMEELEQSFPVEMTIKNGQVYLVYSNEEKEKVVIKCKPDELVMTRFSKPNSVMRFVPSAEAVVQVQTPIGIQHFVTQTSRYQLDMDRQHIVLDYCLKPLEGDQIFAAYKMRISWK